MTHILVKWISELKWDVYPVRSLTDVKIGMRLLMETNTISGLRGRTNIGGGVMVEKTILSRLHAHCRTAPAKFARNLLKALFTLDELRGMSLYGKGTNSRKAGQVKEALDPVCVKAVIGEYATVCRESHDHAWRTLSPEGRGGQSSQSRFKATQAGKRGKLFRPHLCLTTSVRAGLQAWAWNLRRAVSASKKLRRVAVGTSPPSSGTSSSLPPGSRLFIIRWNPQLGRTSTGPLLLGQHRGDGTAHRIEVRIRRSDQRSPQISRHRSGRLMQQHGHVTRRSAARSQLLRRFMYAIAIVLSVVLPLPVKEASTGSRMKVGNRMWGMRQFLHNRSWFNLRAAPFDDYQLGAPRATAGSRPVAEFPRTSLDLNRTIWAATGTADGFILANIGTSEPARRHSRMASEPAAARRRVS
ncbi:uncharacterized protein LOC144125886 [Amblyomma americanum]